HPWFKASAAADSQYRDWYRWDDSCPKYLGPWGEKVWIPLNNSCYYAIFWEGMPDLNYANPAVTTEMDDVANYWLTDMGADGFRLDALQHIVEEGTKQANTASTHTWANTFHQYVDSVKPDALTVGEVNATSFLSAPYVPEGADLVFDFDLANAMIKSANQGNSSSIISQQKIVNGLYPPSQYAAFLNNHDQNRVMGDLGNDVNKAKIAADLLMTQPGVPFIYYGEELGMSGAKPDERLRTPMQWDSPAPTVGFTTGTPWEAPQPDSATVNVAGETSDADSLLSHYRDLISLHNAHPALQHGDFTQVKSASNHVYSFLRHSDEETLLIVINLSGDPVSDYGLSLAKGFGGGTGTLVEGTGDLTEPVVDAEGAFSGYLPLAELAPYSLTVIQFTS
ncbi:MAG: alpha-amylase family glycosyl hydrolase, partial [Chloroflexota bacterium]